MNSVTANGVIASVRAALDGRVITPEDGGYEEARRVFYRSVDRRPAVIARPADAGEVAGDLGEGALGAGSGGVLDGEVVAEELGVLQ